MKHIGNAVWVINDLKYTISKEVIENIFRENKQTIIQFVYDHFNYNISETTEEWIFDTEEEAKVYLIEHLSKKIKVLDSDKKYYIEKINELRWGK